MSLVEILRDMFPSLLNLFKYRRYDKVAVINRYICGVIDITPTIDPSSGSRNVRREIMETIQPLIGGGRQRRTGEGFTRYGGQAYDGPDVLV